MENKENKIKAVRLSEDELENVSGGVGYSMFYTCADCGGEKNFRYEGGYWVYDQSSELPDVCHDCFIKNHNYE